MITKHGLKAEKYDKHGPLFSAEQVTANYVSRTNSGTFFDNKMGHKAMTKEIESATDILNSALKVFEETVERVVKAEQNAHIKTREVTGKIKDTTQKLSDGLAKIESRANFDRLERYVDLLERAEKSMRSLAELQATGKLDKIAAAIRQPHGHKIQRLLQLY